jgi:release factor glutamine methyltransferase
MLESTDTSTSIAVAIFEATKVLREAAIVEPRREAGTLLAHVLGRDRTFVITNAQDDIDNLSLNRFADYVRRRALGEPLQYITGHQQFFGLDFLLTKDVLIPRPETELLVEAALEVLSQGAARPLICDVGTGSGCIVVSLLHTLKDARAVAIDISQAAVKVALSNAAANNVGERIDFVVSNLFSSLSSERRFDLIVSNPPYVASAALKGLQREVRDHEPLIALTAGDDGLAIIRQLLSEGHKQLKRQGHMLFEIGFDQGERVRGLVDAAVWSTLDILPDLQGIPRLVLLQKKE